MTTDREILARTLYGEAERGDEADAIAIAWVVRNRVALPNWPNNVRDVCLQPWQFSCWNADNPNRAKLEWVDASDKWFARLLEIAEAVLGGAIPDPTARSTHYYATYIKAPKWAKGKKPVYETPDGKYTHRFYNDIDTPPPKTAEESKAQQKPPVGAAEIAKDVGIGGAVAAGGATIVNEAVKAADGLPVAVIVAVVVLGLAVAGYLIWKRSRA